MVRRSSKILPAGIWTSDLGREESIKKPSRIAAAIGRRAARLFGVTAGAEAAPFAYVPSMRCTVVSQYDIGPGGIAGAARAAHRRDGRR